MPIVLPIELPIVLPIELPIVLPIGIAYCPRGALPIGIACRAKAPGPDRLGFGLGGQGSWAGPAWVWLGGQGSWAGPAWFLMLRRTMTVTGMLI